MQTTIDRRQDGYLAIPAPDEQAMPEIGEVHLIHGEAGGQRNPPPSVLARGNVEGRDLLVDVERVGNAVAAAEVLDLP